MENRLLGGDRTEDRKFSKGQTVVIGLLGVLFGYMVAVANPLQTRTDVSVATVPSEGCQVTEDDICVDHINRKSCQLAYMRQETELSDVNTVAVSESDDTGAIASHRGCHLVCPEPHNCHIECNSEGDDINALEQNAAASGARSKGSDSRSKDCKQACDKKGNCRTVCNGEEQTTGKSDSSSILCKEACDKQGNCQRICQPRERFTGKDLIASDEETANSEQIQLDDSTTLNSPAADGKVCRLVCDPHCHLICSEPPNEGDDINALQENAATSDARSKGSDSRSKGCKQACDEKGNCRTVCNGEEQTTGKSDSPAIICKEACDKQGNNCQRICKSPEYFTGKDLIALDPDTVDDSMMLDSQECANHIAECVIEQLHYEQCKKKHPDIAACKITHSLREEIHLSGDDSYNTLLHPTPAQEMSGIFSCIFGGEEEEGKHKKPVNQTDVIYENKCLDGEYSFYDLICVLVISFLVGFFIDRFFIIECPYFCGPEYETVYDPDPARWYHNVPGHQYVGLARGGREVVRVRGENSDNSARV